VRHSKLEVVYALKTFRDEFLDDPKARDSFKKKVSLWVNLEDHPFILPAKIVHEFSGRLFVFMEYIEPDAKGRINLAGGGVQNGRICIFSTRIQFRPKLFQSIILPVVRSATE
jgi:hypothetical protein